jgi:hypothetical protein
MNLLVLAAFLSMNPASIVGLYGKKVRPIEASCHRNRLSFLCDSVIRRLLERHTRGR